MSQLRTARILIASSALLSLANCAGSIDINEKALVYGQSGVPQAPGHPTKVTYTNPVNVARVSILDTNVLKWSEVAQDLQLAQFSYTGNDLYNISIATTSSTSNAYIDQFVGKVAATIGGIQTSNQNETATDAAGNKTTTSDRKSTQTTPAVPDYSAASTPPSIVTSGVQGATSGIETLTRFQEAAALAEEIAILNKRVSGLSMPRGYIPYFVSFQVGVAPTGHGYPYDTTIHIQFEPKDFDITDKVEADDEVPIPLVHPGGGHITTACDAKFTGIEVMPLLVTDSLESTSETDVSDIVRQLGAAIKGSGGIFGGSAQVERTLSKINQSQAMRLNSLLSVTREGRSCMAVRLGANRYGNSYEMVSRNHNVSVVILVPENQVKDETWLDKGQYRTPKIKVTGIAEFNDPVWYLANRPFPDPNAIRVAADYVNLPLIDTPSCPPYQYAILTSAVVPGASQAAELNKSVIILNASRGIDLSNVTAELITPATLSGVRLNLKSQEISSVSAGELRFQFPAQGGLFAAKSVDQVQTGYLRFSIITDGLLYPGTVKDHRHIKYCPDTWDGNEKDDNLPILEKTSYKVAYIIAAAPKPANTAAKSTKPAKTVAAATPPATGTATATAAVDPATQAPLPSATMSSSIAAAISSATKSAATVAAAPKVTLPY